MYSFSCLVQSGRAPTRMALWFSNFALRVPSAEQKAAGKRVTVNRQSNWMGNEMSHILPKATWSKLLNKEISAIIRGRLEQAENHLWVCACSQGEAAEFQPELMNRGVPRWKAGLLGSLIKFLSRCVSFGESPRFLVFSSATWKKSLSLPALSVSLALLST